MTTPLLQHSPEYLALLRRWRQLRDKEKFDGLTRQEAKEFEGVNEQLGSAEMAYEQREQEQSEIDDLNDEMEEWQNAALCTFYQDFWDSPLDAFDEMNRIGDFGAVEL